MQVWAHQLTWGLQFSPFCTSERPQRFPNSFSLLEDADVVPLLVFILLAFHYPWSLVSLKDAP